MEEMLMLSLILAAAILKVQAIAAKDAAAAAELAYFIRTGHSSGAQTTADFGTGNAAITNGNNRVASGDNNAITATAYRLGAAGKLAAGEWANAFSLANAAKLKYDLATLDYQQACLQYQAAQTLFVATRARIAATGRFRNWSES